MLFKNQLFISVLVLVVVYTVVYRTTVEDKRDPIGYDQSSLVYAALAGAFAYLGLRYYSESPPVRTETNTRLVNGENIMVAPYSTST